MQSEDTTESGDFDAIVVGAGFAGLYLLHLLRGSGFRTRVIEAADGVGGTWYFNRYPGARCDIRSIDYSYSFDPQLEQEWEWSEKFATQPEILRYANHVADRFDLRRDIQFETRVRAAHYNEAHSQWIIETDSDETVSARFFVMATGCLSTSKLPEVPGIDDFGGETFHTGRWPHHPIDFSGKRVGVIGTGSSAIQSIPMIADQADQLTVFQRTPNFSMPAHNGPVDPDELAAIKSDYPTYREAARRSYGGVPGQVPTDSALDVSSDARLEAYEGGWEIGGLAGLVSRFNDIRINQESNDTAAEFARNKIRELVDDPEVAEALCPHDYPLGTKRLCVDDGYFATFNRQHVRLVDLRKTPITNITATGIDTADESFEFDALVFATGFDAMTGTIAAVDIRGRDGLELTTKWEHGPLTYLGLTAAGFPNFFAITGPGSPSVLSNMMVSIEQHVEWIGDCLTHMNENCLTMIEPTEEAEQNWVEHVFEVGQSTLYPKANSWYMGANVPGKPRVFLPYVGGVGTYRAICEEVVADNYRGFTFA